MNERYNIFIFFILLYEHEIDLSLLYGIYCFIEKL